MLAENLQIDSLTNNIINVLFNYNDKTLEFHRLSDSNYLIPNDAPIGVFMSGGQAQVILIDEDNTKYEAYVYYYNKQEGPRNFILQTLELEKGVNNE